MTPLQTKFAKRFGKKQAEAIQSAAEEHANGINSERKGSDQFRWALAITIGYECWSKDSYRKYHGITADAEAIRRWIKRNARLAEHDGDVDYMAAFAGAYAPYMPSKKAAR